MLLAELNRSVSQGDLPKATNIGDDVSKEYISKKKKCNHKLPKQPRYSLCHMNGSFPFEQQNMIFPTKIQLTVVSSQREHISL